MNVLQEPPLTPPTRSAAPDANALMGTIRSFGEFGRVYQVVSRKDDASFHVIVPETGEEFDYAVERALNDPEAA